MFLLSNPRIALQFVNSVSVGSISSSGSASDSGECTCCQTIDGEEYCVTCDCDSCTCTRSKYGPGCDCD